MKAIKLFLTAAGVLILLALFVSLSPGCQTFVTKLSQAKMGKSANPIIQVKKVLKAPEVDGKDSEDVWKQAKEVTISLRPQPGVEPTKINLKAVYTDKDIYILSSYKDSTPIKIGDVWEYDGQKWVRGPYDDTLAFLWNMNDSIKGFNERGFSVMTKGLSSKDDIFDFQIEGKGLKDGKVLERYKADFWGW